jgi:UDP-N-acetylglucosamine 1-carboxyvinyltransferase
MESLHLEGGARLCGHVAVEGAKNAALPTCVASLLTEHPIVVHGVPRLRDVSTILFTLSDLGKRVIRSETSVVIRCGSTLSHEANPYSVRQMRASFLVLGPLVARLGRAVVPLPGGCAIGRRPVDSHLKGLRALGARVEERGDAVVVHADGLRGHRIELPFPSVGATEQLLMAATLARGETEIINGSIEPEVEDLVCLLRKMGAEVEARGRTYLVSGRRELGGAEHALIPDRMEAGTFLLAAAATGGEVHVENVIPEHIASLLAVLRATGLAVTESARAVSVAWGGRRSSARVVTEPYPGFPTDLQPPLAAYLCLVPGTSAVTETVFERRFAYAEQLRGMGAKISVAGKTVTVDGVGELHGGSVVATDIRAGAALVVAGLAARGRTTIACAEHIDRGYAALEKKLRGLGANIERRSG